MLIEFDNLIMFFSEKYWHCWHACVRLSKADWQSTGNPFDVIRRHILFQLDPFNRTSCLQNEVSRLRKELAEKESQLSAKPAEKAVYDELSGLNILSQETSENVQERINLQKALFELEDTNLHNHAELQQLDDAIAKQQVRLA